MPSAKGSGIVRFYHDFAVYVRLVFFRGIKDIRCLFLHLLRCDLGLLFVWEERVFKSAAVLDCAP